MNLRPKAARQDLCGLEGGVRASALDAADLALVHPRLLRELPLGEPEGLAARDELAGELEVRAEGFRLRDRPAPSLRVSRSTSRMNSVNRRPMR